MTQSYTVTTTNSLKPSDGVVLVESQKAFPGVSNITDYAFSIKNRNNNFISVSMFGCYQSYVQPSPLYEWAKLLCDTTLKVVWQKIGSKDSSYGAARFFLKMAITFTT